MDHFCSAAPSICTIDGSSAMSYKECARKTANANDLLRTTCTGAELEISNGVAALPPKLIAEALFTMRTFSEFDMQNDPYQIHDFGSFDIDGQTFLFQVQSRRGDGERGLCKLMLAGEYRGVVRYPIVEQVAGLGIERGEANLGVSPMPPTSKDSFPFAASARS